MLIPSPKRTTVYVDAGCDICYASFYILGIWKVFGRANTIFTSAPFQKFRHSNHFFPFIVKQNGIAKKLVIDYSDSPALKEEAYQWADVYGKVNIAFEDMERFSKLVPLGPGFAVRIFSAPQTLFYAALHLLKGAGRIADKKRFLADYRGQLRRLPLSAYLQRTPARTDYLYFIATLWKKETATNGYRANFIKVARQQPGINFEGGFAPRRANDMTGFEDLTLAGRSTLQEYLAKTKDSMAVFNTPAVLACHGWKLGEYLALGKCILSTPLSRVMPGEFLAGTHYLETDGSMQDQEKKLQWLKQNEDLRKSLEQEAATYFDEYLAPEKVIGIMCSK
jgi:hypothetical protein